jgi:hypothetical protein
MYISKKTAALIIISTTITFSLRFCHTTANSAFTQPNLSEQHRQRRQHLHISTSATATITTK